MITCRFCGKSLNYIFLSLGSAPLSNAYLKKEDLGKMEPFYPLDVYVCEECFLVQLPEFESPEHIFSDYAYFSSYSDTWLKHAKEYADKITEKYNLNSRSFVIEIASNDGYLLQYFLQKGIPVLGIEPAKNVAEAALKKGIPTDTVFWGEKTAARYAEKEKRADLIIGNNVLAHVPDVNDFVKGLKILLKPHGIITLEFPHLMRLVDNVQFDTIYHEHFSYFSLLSVERIFEAHELAVFDVEEIPTHGGSLRIHVRHKNDAVKPVSPAVNLLLQKERDAGYAGISFYLTFTAKVHALKWDILKFLSEAKLRGKIIAGYGAPAKGNTLLNYCGIKTDFIEYTADRNPHKQKCFLPGSHIPVETPEKIRKTKPDYVLILPWNIKEEIMEQLSYIRDWNGKFIVCIPHVQVF